jgi:preprotein translocase subunit YajC
MDNPMLMLLLFVVMIVFFILPQMRKQKKEKNFVSALKKGDKVMMKSGMYGKIAELNDSDNTCIIETSAGKIKFDRSAISSEMTMKLNKPVVKK